jgi:hypothetical protein
LGRKTTFMGADGDEIEPWDDFLIEGIDQRKLEAAETEQYKLLCILCASLGYLIAVVAKLSQLL